MNAVDEAREQAWNDFMGDYYAEEGPVRADEARNDRVCFNSGWDARATCAVAVGRYGECATCGQPYERFDSPGGVFYSHFEHPDDDHDATPLSVDGDNA